MAVERAKVLAAIETKLKGKSLSKNFKENLASKWAEKIETDEHIESYVDDREDVLLEASSEADRRATEAANKAKSEKGTEPSTQPKQPETQDEPKKDEMPGWAKNLFDEVKTLRAEKTQSSLEAKRHAILKEKGIPEATYKLIPLPENEEALTTQVESIVSNYTELQQAITNSSVSTGKPAGGTGATGAKVDPDLIAFAKKQNETVSK